MCFLHIKSTASDTLIYFLIMMKASFMVIWFCPSWINYLTHYYYHHCYCCRHRCCSSPSPPASFSTYQFYLRPVLGIVVACVCVCVCLCVCVNHLLVRVMTRDPFKLGSPNLDQRCKRPWLRSLWFCGLNDCDLQGQIELESPNLPHFELVCTITHHLFKLGSPNLDQRCKIAWLRSL